MNSASAETVWVSAPPQYASAWMTADIYRDGFHYHLDFQKGENVGGLHKEPYKAAAPAASSTGSRTMRSLPTSTSPAATIKMSPASGVVNAGLTLNFTDEKEKDPATGKPWKESWCYEHGIADYVLRRRARTSLTRCSAARAKPPVVTAKTSRTIR